MIVDELKKSILQQVFQGNLSEQLKSDSDVDIILNKITEIKNNNIKKKTFKKTPIGKEINAEDVKYNIPNSWRWIRFIDLCSVMTCGYASTPQYVKNGMPFLSAKNVKPYEFKPQEYKMISKELYEKLTSTCKPERNDILLTRVGAGIGECAIINVSMDFAIYVSLTLIKLVDYELISNKYILYWLNSPYGISNSVNNITGKDSSQGNLNVDDVRNFLIPFPPIEEQRRIVDKIEEVFTKLDEIKPIEEELRKIKNNFPNDMIKSIILSAISGKLSYQNDNEKINIQQLKSITKVAEPFMIPGNWLWLGHNDLFEVIGGSQPPKSKFSNINCDGFVQLYQTRDYGPNPQPVFVDRKDVSKFTKKGDIILARYGGSLGKVFWAEDGAYNVALAKVVLKYPTLINIKYLYYYYLGGLYQSKVKNGNRSAQAGFSKDDLNDLSFPLPPIEEQQRIVDKLEQLLPLCDDIEKIINRIEN